MKVKYSNGGGLPYGPPKQGPFDSDQYYFEKGVKRQLKKDMRREERAANREGRRTGYFPARPSDVDFLLNALSEDRLNRQDMVRKGFRGDALRALGKFGAGVGLATLGGAYSNAPKQITRPSGTGLGPNVINLSPTQRLAYILGLGPY
jgi:hypothetical protein